MANKISLKEQLKDYLRERPFDWISGHELEKFAIAVGYKASTGARVCRNLENEGVFERQETTQGYVQYRYKSILSQQKSQEAQKTEPKQIGIFYL